MSLPKTPATNDSGPEKTEAEGTTAGGTSATENGDIYEERGNWVCHLQNFPSLSKVKSMGTRNTKSSSAVEGRCETPPISLVIDLMYFDLSTLHISPYKGCMGIICQLTALDSVPEPV
jgi:hypothetical protein